MPSSKNSCYIETSQMICKALQLTGFYAVRVFSERCFQTDLKTVFEHTNTRPNLAVHQSWT